MSAVCVLTPIVIGNWPVIQTAIFGAITAMGFSMGTGRGNPTLVTCGRVEESIPNSEVLEDHMTTGEKIIATRDDLQIEVGRDVRGACTICVSGAGYTDGQLRKIAREVSSKIVQQYTYHKVITELKEKQYSVTNEVVTSDGTIKIHVRRGGR